ncbi:MAG: SDR family oxidoreductase [Deltaproteobacteria bacterium]|uniref:3-dehydrosphinganine reductase n=1 Tax=Candidatus Zymogenus saltonus TaxID=2844893 RepID=A0A9D8KD25_9DELT|nr:SDR family oxidoreductase [Candidatus Zymogenus saltonus]
MKDFNGKTAYVVGGSSGIGLSTAKLLASLGAHVIIFARGKKRLDDAVAEIKGSTLSKTQKVASFSMDVSDNKAVNTIMNGCVEEFGPPDLLINSAGRARPHYFGDITFDMFDETMKMNAYGVWNTISALVPHMKVRGGGYIANVSSMAGFLGVFGYTDYAASKFAVTGLSEALRSEMKPFGITVSILCPPDTQTPGFNVENLTKPVETKVLSENAKVMTSDAVAKGFIKGIRKGRFMIIPGFDGNLTYLAKRLVPGVVEMVMNSTIKKVQKRMK